jgi:hypothetical protein
MSSKGLNDTAEPRFTVVIFWTVWGNFFGGFASAGGGSLGPDVLPVGADGRPSNAGRDSQLQGWAGRVPSVFPPPPNRDWDPPETVLGPQKYLLL